MYIFLFFGAFVAEKKINDRMKYHKQKLSTREIVLREVGSEEGVADNHIEVHVMYLHCK